MNPFIQITEYLTYQNEINIDDCSIRKDKHCISWLYILPICFWYVASGFSNDRVFIILWLFLHKCHVEKWWINGMDRYVCNYSCMMLNRQALFTTSTVCHIHSHKQTLLIRSWWCNCYMKAMSIKYLSLIRQVHF